MSNLQRVHIAAAIINGFAAAAAALGRYGAAIALLIVSSLLLIWSLERLRFHAVTGSGA